MGWSLAKKVKAGQSQDCSNFTPYAALQYCYLKDDDLAGDDLQGANLTGAYMVGTDLDGTDLQLANLTTADLTNASADSANLSGADIDHGYLINTELNGADLAGAAMSDTNVASADMTEADRVTPPCRRRRAPTASPGRTPPVLTRPIATTTVGPASTTLHPNKRPLQGNQGVHWTVGRARTT